MTLDDGGAGSPLARMESLPATNTSVSDEQLLEWIDLVKPWRYADNPLINAELKDALEPLIGNIGNPPL